ncbi:MAG: DUF2309 domain-containing protein [Cytophagia bacterium]|nr:MAG: DUF2309 domain-containing protein [Cytophagia bacterium]
MSSSKFTFDEEEVLHELKHHLPAQMPLKDFVHHNTLHSFQNKNFYNALHEASEIFGYNTTLFVEDYREMLKNNHIEEKILDKMIISEKGKENFTFWKDKVLSYPYKKPQDKKVGRLRPFWKDAYEIDINAGIRPSLFRILNAYFDQGISIWQFPTAKYGLLGSIREVEKNSFISFFKTNRVRKMLLAEKQPQIIELLKILVGNDTSLYKQYLYDQQFMHPGWSGMVATLEENPHGLLDKKPTKLKDLIILELLLEIDALENEVGKNWLPLAEKIKIPAMSDIHDISQENKEYYDVIKIWQNAFEWTYYDGVLAGLQSHKEKEKPKEKSFQAMFCIDDRECSMRRYLEATDENCETFGLPGFFGVPFWYKPLGGKSYIKLCPVPLNPKNLICEIDDHREVRKKDMYLSQHTHRLFRGWLIVNTIGFLSIIRLFLNLFRPTLKLATVSSLKHTSQISHYTIENKNVDDKENGYQIGFTIDEMVVLVENVLRNIGFIDNYAPLVYVVGHGATSVNNPHYAAYDCGACSGRPGSINARVLCYMANHPEVRKRLSVKNIIIPSTTQFVPAIHDTTRDEFEFYDDVVEMSEENKILHRKNKHTFHQASDKNSKERACYFDTMDIKQKDKKIHQQIKRRSVSLFEPRPELNHADNALCIVARRQLSADLFLNRRSFLNSYDHTTDPDGTYLFNVLSAAIPVIGGINLEYYFSKVDNHKLGVGTKLPLNVMGLIGVANGIDGDLKPGLPSQMVELHDPVRLMLIVEHSPEIILNTINKSQSLHEWVYNQWINLACINPYNQLIYIFKDGQFEEYKPIQTIEHIKDIDDFLEHQHDNIHTRILD